MLKVCRNVMDGFEMLKFLALLVKDFQYFLQLK